MGPGSLPEEDWLKLGFLKHAGYRVGQHGATNSVRRSALTHAFKSSSVPMTFPAEYRAEWGTPDSAARLKKMAECMATFCRNAKRKEDPAYALSIVEWEIDLAWLKTTYYDGRFELRFVWPVT